MGPMGPFIIFANIWGPRAPHMGGPGPPFSRKKKIRAPARIFILHRGPGPRKNHGPRAPQIIFFFRGALGPHFYFGGPWAPSLSGGRENFKSYEKHNFNKNTIKYITNTIKYIKKYKKIQTCTKKNKNMYTHTHTHTHPPARRTLRTRPPAGVCVCVCVQFFDFFVHFCIFCTYLYIV